MSFSTKNIAVNQLQVNACRLEQRLAGHGARKLLVVGSALYYQRVFPELLLDALQVAFVDHRGYARSCACTQPEHLTLDTTVEDIEQHRLALGWEDCIVLGHSGHGFMALEYAKRHKEHVSGVVLMNVGPSYGTADIAVTEREWEALVDPERKKIWRAAMSGLEGRICAEPDKRFLLYMLAMGARSWADPSYDAEWLWKDVPINLPHIDQMWGKDFAEIDLSKGLSDFERPVLLGMGQWDYLVPRLQCWDRLTPAFSDLTVRLFAKSGHTPMLEEPRVFCEVLFDWIDEKGL